MTESCIADDAAVKHAVNNEIVRRYFTALRDRREDRIATSPCLGPS